MASELRPANVIPIEDDPVETDAGSDEVASGDVGADTADEGTDPVQVIETDDLPDADAAGDQPADEATDEAAAEAGDRSDSGDADTSNPDTSDTAADTDDEVAGDTSAPTDTADDTTDGADTTAAEAPASDPQPPLSAADDALGTGGGVDDAECALDRLVIYAGARVGGVAGSIRNALAQAGFAAGCPAPVTVLASNCPLQFAGVLGPDSGYDPTQSFVASSASVDRETMTAVMGTVGFSGNEINILDFGFVNPDKPGEQWMAIFIPPSFAGWENLAGRAGVSSTSASLCAPSGELAG